MSVLFNKVEDLCRQNPNFHSILVVSLFKAAVAKKTSPKVSNAKIDVIVLNFIRLIITYDKKSAQVVSANIGGPGDQWVRKMNYREQNYCIINSGEENKRVVQRMEADIEWRKMQGGKGTFSLYIDATKFAQVLEVLRAHGAIIGG